MPYEIKTDRPESDAPVSKETNYLQWYQWAKTNAPFTSATLAEWTAYLSTLNHPSTRRERDIMANEGTLDNGQVQRVLKLAKDRHDGALPDKVQKVFQFAADNGYGVTFTPSDETAFQYASKAGS